MDISVVVVNWNTRNLLLNCLASVFETMEGMAFEVLLVDNGSEDGSVEAIKKTYPHVRIIGNNSNLGFAAANNQAFKKIRGRYALLLNTDAVLTHGAVASIFDFMDAHPHVAMACGQLLNADGSRQNSIANFPTPITFLCNETLLRLLFPKQYPSKRKEYVEPIEVDSCIGACMMVRRKAMDEVGLLDEVYFFFFEETDWAYRMQRAGWKVCFVPSAKIYHLQGQSVGHDVSSRFLFFKSRYIYLRRWHRRLYPFLCLLIFLRLYVNAVLNLLGVIGTLGFHTGVKNKLSMSASLIRWHVKDNPQNIYGDILEGVVSCM